MNAAISLSFLWEPTVSGTACHLRLPLSQKSTNCFLSTRDLVAWQNTHKPIGCWCVEVCVRTGSFSTHLKLVTWLLMGNSTLLQRLWRLMSHTSHRAKGAELQFTCGPKFLTFGWGWKRLFSCSCFHCFLFVQVVLNMVLGEASWCRCLTELMKHWKASSLSGSSQGQESFLMDGQAITNWSTFMMTTTTTMLSSKSTTLWTLKMSLSVRSRFLPCLAADGPFSAANVDYYQEIHRKDKVHQVVASKKEYCRVKEAKLFPGTNRNCYVTGERLKNQVFLSGVWSRKFLRVVTLL